VWAGEGVWDVEERREGDSAWRGQLKEQGYAKGSGLIHSHELISKMWALLFYFNYQLFEYNFQ
jgi:hypothetical protein